MNLFPKTFLDSIEHFEIFLYEVQNYFFDLLRAEILCSLSQVTLQCIGFHTICFLWVLVTFQPHSLDISKVYYVIYYNSSWFTDFVVFLFYFQQNRSKLKNYCFDFYSDIKLSKQLSNLPVFILYFFFFSVSKAFVKFQFRVKNKSIIKIKLNEIFKSLQYILRNSIFSVGRYLMTNESGF